jgi:riboflavin synthase
MFTGLIQAVGSVAEIAGSRLVIRVPEGLGGDPFVLGESVAVNGCCLTVVSAGPALAAQERESQDSAAALPTLLAFDLSEETLARTTLGSLQPGSPVHLERALRPADRIGGHFVQGHVDGVGELVSRTPAATGETLRFRVPEGGERYLMDKGSIALDGVSLTIVGPRGREFDVAAIPHTLAATTLGSLRPGDQVNVEYDLLAKYALRNR